MLAQVLEVFYFFVVRENEEAISSILIALAPYFLVNYTF